MLEARCYIIAGADVRGTKAAGCVFEGDVCSRLCGNCADFPAVMTVI